MSDLVRVSETPESGEPSWHKDWRKWIRQNQERHAKSGASYPYDVSDPVSEIVARAVMSKSSGPKGARKPEEGEEM